MKEVGSIFDSLAGEPASWLAIARQHLAAARTLHTAHRQHMWPSTDLDAQLGYFRGTLLLLALAVENALKALLLAQGKIAVTAEGLDLPRITGAPTGHELPALAQESGLVCNDYESDLLVRLATFSVWAGKYSVPKKRPVFEAAEEDGIRVLRSPIDLETARSLIQRIHTQLEVQWPVA